MRKLRNRIRLLGIIFILLPLFTSTVKYDVSSSEDILLSEARVQEIEHVENTESASDLNITGVAGALTMAEIPVIKRAYITIDDGPSVNTDRILDILNMYGVKATFFVNNKQGADNMLRYQRIVNEGHTIGLHSSTHEYKSVYRDDEAFLADLQANQSYIASITGVVPVVYRFPGGSNNSVAPHGTDSFINILNNLGIAYYDWNSYVGDAVKKPRPKDVLVSNALSGCNGKNDVMILMHDTPEKKSTVEALPEIIEGLAARGYLILPIDPSVPSTTPVFHFK
ncbi:MAG: polysaccharide deacetylase [Lachnospiraceae bacterium]|nr:polysaccharide deacetylase [Lachnospiraceae bacterium]